MDENAFATKRDVQEIVDKAIDRLIITLARQFDRIENRFGLVDCRLDKIEETMATKDDLKGLVKRTDANEQDIVLIKRAVVKGS